MQIRVRPADPGDAQTVYAFVRALAEHEGEPDRIGCTAADLEAQLRATPPPFECLLAEVDASVVGIALFHYSFSTWRGSPAIWVQDLFVAPTHRRQRVGHRLLVELARVATHRGITQVQWQGLTSSEAATLFSQFVGARPMLEWTSFRLNADTLGALAQGETPGSPEEAAKAEPLLLAHHAQLETEFTWVCSDPAGHLAAFCISKHGPAPAAALQAPALMDRTYEALDGLAPCGGATRTSEHQTDAYYSERLAERGVFAFDWVPSSDSYVLIARPSVPRRVEDLRTAEDREAASRIVLSTTLADRTEFSRADLEAALRPASGMAPP